MSVMTKSVAGQWLKRAESAERERDLANSNVAGWMSRHAEAHRELAEAVKERDALRAEFAELKRERDGWVGTAEARLREWLAAKDERDALRSRVASLEAQKNGAYAERNKCVAALARLALLLGWKTGVREHPAKDALWESDWRTIVAIDLPAGQVTWHFHDSEKHLLGGLPRYVGQWDGHTTDEKYQRLAALPSAPAWRESVRRECLEEAAKYLDERADGAAARSVDWENKGQHEYSDPCAEEMRLAHAWADCIRALAVTRPREEGPLEVPQDHAGLARLLRTAGEKLATVDDEPREDDGKDGTAK